MFQSFSKHLLKQEWNDKVNLKEIKLGLLEKKVLELLLEIDTPMKQNELADKLGVKRRQVQYSMKKLVREHIIIKQPDLQDLRSQFYTFNIPKKDISTLVQ